MAITLNTNLSSLIAQRNLDSATKMLNTSIERMTTGYKINHGKDNAAGYSIATRWNCQISSLEVAAENAAMGMDMLTTTEESYGLVISHLQRIRDLTEQAANGTYDSTSTDAIKAEISVRLDEIDRVAANAKFNGLSIMSSNDPSDVNLQIGLTAADVITLDGDLFKNAKATVILRLGGSSTNDDFATACTGANAATQLAKIDTAIDTISTRVTNIGAVQNRVESAITSITIQRENLISSLSTIKDADVAAESSSYIKGQILQQAAATLLATANQTPSIALSLI